MSSRLGSFARFDVLSASTVACGAVASTLLFSACRGTEYREIDDALIPEEVAWVAIVPQAPGPGSGLVPRRDLSAITAFDTNPEALLLIGFEDGQVPDQRPPEPELRSKILEPAGPAESRLPTPIYSARLEAPDRPVELEYDLRAGWMPNCPVVIPETSLVAADCNACAPVATQNACTVKITLKACGFADAELDVSQTGALRIRGSEISCMELADRPEDAILSLGCSTRGADQCRADVYGPKRLALAASALDFSFGAPTEALSFAGLGFFGDLAVLGPGELGVTHFFGRFEPDRVCESNEPSELLVLDTSLAERARIPMPPCAAKIAGLPDETILVVHDGSRTLSRVDRSGQTIRSLAIPVDEAQRAVFDLIVDGTTAYLLSTGAKRDDGVLRRVSLPDLAITATITVPPQTGPLFRDRGRLFTISNQLDAVVEVRDDVRPVVGVAGLCFGSSVNLNGISGDEEHFVLSSLGETPFIYLVDVAGNACQRAAYFERLADPRGVARLEGDRYWVSLTDRASPPEALFAVYDKGRAGFVPGSVTVGHGTVDSLVSVDQLGFAMLREEGKVVRVELVE